MTFWFLSISFCVYSIFGWDRNTHGAAFYGILMAFLDLVAEGFITS